jgi:hypothetical protein
MGVLQVELYFYDKTTVKLKHKKRETCHLVYFDSQQYLIYTKITQILLTQDSARVHRELQRSLPVLRRLARQKLNDHQILLMGEILDALASDRI